MIKNKILYGLFNPLNGECFYIGITNNLTDRLKKHIRRKGNNKAKEKIIEELLTVGLKPIIKKLLIIPSNYHKRLDLEEWHLYEIYFIKYVRDKYNINLTNVAKGGDGGNSNGTNKPVIQFDLGGNYIKEWNSIKEAANTLNIFNTAIGICCKGKIKQVGGYQWCYKGEEYKIGKYVKPIWKPVMQFDLDGNFIKEWNNIVDAANTINIKQGSIGQCCKGNNNYKHTGGYQWCYKGEEDRIGKYVKPIWKPVIQFDLDGNFIKEWNSMADAANTLNINKSNISQCCNGKGRYKRVGGYQWCYKGEENRIGKYIK